MKFRWIPVLILISTLVGVVLGIRIHDVGSIIQQKEKQTSKAPTINREQIKIENQKIITEKNQSSNQQVEEESTEVFSNTSKAKEVLPQAKRSLLSKMANGLDNGVSNVFSHLISKLN